MNRFIIPAAGRAYLAGLLAGERIRLSRVVVGSGRLTEDIDPDTLTELIEYVADATSTEMVRYADTVSFMLEYRNEMSPDTPAWALNEYGVFALDAEDNEVLLYYVTLDTPQPIPQYAVGELTVVRYPVIIAVSANLEVVPLYMPNAWLTAEEVAALIAAHNTDPQAHEGMLDRVAVMLSGLEGRVRRLEDAVFNDVTGNPFLVTFDALDGLYVAGAWNVALQRIEF